MTWVPDDGPWLERHVIICGPSTGSGRRVHRELMRVEAATGASQPLFTYAQLESALAKSGRPVECARTASRRRPSNFNAKRTHFC